VLVVVVLAAVSVVSYPSVGGAGPTEAALRASVLTPDGNDGSSIVGATDAVTMTANPGNTGGNLRTLVWPEHAPTARDETVCATWQEASSHVVQEGLALRIAPGAAGQLAAITVTKNVYGGAEWWFNVHVWHGAGLGDQIAGVDLSRVFAPGDHKVVRALPWRVCARTRGDELELLAWPLTEPTPRWGDPTHGGRVHLPPSAPRTGVAGWYVGHLHAGMHATYGDLQGAVPADGAADRQAAAGRVGAVALTG